MIDAQHLGPRDRVQMRTKLDQVVQFTELLQVVLDLGRSILGPIVYNSAGSRQVVRND